MRRRRIKRSAKMRGWWGSEWVLDNRKLGFVVGLGSCFPTSSATANETWVAAVEVSLLSQRGALHSMKKKHLIAIFSSVIGASGAWASYSWPRYAVAIQMALFTSFVFVPLFMFFWSERVRRPFWICISVALVAHGLLLCMIRSIFPFSSVLVLVPIAIVEASVIFTAIDKITGERSVERPAPAPNSRNKMVS
jgi:hypothetical protein